MSQMGTYDTRRRMGLVCIALAGMGFCLLAGCTRMKRLSPMPYPELDAYTEPVPIALVFGSFTDRRTVLEKEFRGWWQTCGRVPVEMEELRLHISKLITRRQVFDRVMVLDQTTYPSYQAEVAEAKTRGADILVRCRLSSMEFTSSVDAFWAAVGIAITFPGGGTLAAANAGGLLIVAIAGEFDTMMEKMRWVLAGDLVFPCVIGQIKPLVYIEIVDVSTGQQLAESSVEWQVRKHSHPILFYSEWISKARRLLAIVYEPLSEDIARIVAGEINKMMKRGKAAKEARWRDGNGTNRMGLRPAG